MVRTRHEWWIWMQEEEGGNVSLAGTTSKAFSFPTVHCLCWTPIHHLIHLHFPSTDLIPPPPAPSYVWVCAFANITVFHSSTCDRMMLSCVANSFLRMPLRWRDVGAAFGVVLTRVDFEDDSGRRVRIYIEGTFLIETWIFYSISFVLFGVLGALNISFSILTRSSSLSSSQGILWSSEYCHSPCALEKFNGFGYTRDVSGEEEHGRVRIFLEFLNFPFAINVPPPSSTYVKSQKYETFHDE